MWLCEPCAELPIDRIAGGAICTECFADIAPMVGNGVRIIGNPEVVSRPTQLRFETAIAPVDAVDSASVIGLGPVASKATIWLAVTLRGHLVEMDVASGKSRLIAHLGDPTSGLFDEADYPGELVRKHELYELGLSSKSPNSGYAHRQVFSGLAAELPITVLPAADGAFVAVCNRWGRRGVVISTATGRTEMRLDRGDYLPEQTQFPVAWVTRGSEPLLVHATAWNRLDVSDLASGFLLTKRGPTSYGDGETKPKHYLDYFHGGLAVSPASARIAEDGWVWHPVGVTASWSLDAWLGGNVWESEDGPSRRSLTQRDHFWDAPICWLNDSELVVWGIGDDDDWMVPGVRVFDAESGRQLRDFGGPIGQLVFDRHLVAYSTTLGTTVWDPQTGERLLASPDVRPLAFHPADHRFISRGDGQSFALSRLVTDDREPLSDLAAAEKD